METRWKSRIVGYGEVRIDQVLANEKNWRIHGASQQEKLTALLQSVGIVQNIIINKRTSPLWPVEDRNVETLLDGHCRIALGLRHGQECWPCTYVDLEPNAENLVLGLLDPLGAMASMDKPAYRALLADTTTGEAALMQLFSDLAGVALLPSPDTTQAPQPEMIPCPTCGALMPQNVS